MLIRLLRNKPKANAITGRLILGDAPLTLATLEPWQYAIPAGCYRLRLTYSPTFQELLPLLDGVLGYARQPHNGIRRTGIRIHAGNTIADSRGCILVGEAGERLLGDEARSIYCPTRYTTKQTDKLAQGAQGAARLFVELSNTTPP